MSHHSCRTTSWPDSRLYGEILSAKKVQTLALRMWIGIRSLTKADNQSQASTSPIIIKLQNRACTRRQNSSWIKARPKMTEAALYSLMISLTTLPRWSLRRAKSFNQSEMERTSPCSRSNNRTKKWAWKSSLSSHSNVFSHNDHTPQFTPR